MLSISALLYVSAKKTFQLFYMSVNPYKTIREATKKNVKNFTHSAFQRDFWKKYQKIDPQ